MNSLSTSRLLLILVMVMTVFAAAQEKKGQVGFRFLENPLAAEMIGRGGVGIIDLRNANAAFWNPAGLGWIESRFDFTANYTRGIADINHSSVAGALKLGSWGVLALDLLVMDYGDFYGTRRADNEQGFIDTGTFSPQAYALGLSFSQRITDRFTYGVRIKYAHQDLGSAWIARAGSDVDDPELIIEQKTYRAGEPALDVGAIYDFFFRSIRFGAVIHNVSREVRYEEDKFPLPFAASFSLSVDPLSLISNREQSNHLVIAFESRHPRDFKEKYNLGVEYNYSGFLMLRAGYMGNYDERGLTLGLGVVKNVTNLSFRFDYAYQDFGIFSAVHTFSFGASF